MAINFQLSGGTSGQPNYFTAVRSKALTEYSYRLGGLPPATNKRANNLPAKTFECTFGVDIPILKQGEGLIMFFAEDVRKIVDFNMIIDNPTTPANGLGSSSQFSLGLATLDKSQTKLLQGANNNSTGASTNTDGEGLPIFTAKLDNSGAFDISFKTNRTYFLGNTSGVPTSPATSITFGVFNVNNMYLNDLMKAGFANEVIALFNTGTIDITQGRVRANILFA